MKFRTKQSKGGERLLGTWDGYFCCLCAKIKCFRQKFTALEHVQANVAAEEAFITSVTRFNFL